MTTKNTHSSISSLSDAAKAALFQELLRQMACDNVTLLWESRDSLSGDELVANLQSAIAARQAAATDGAPETEPVEGNPAQAYQFEAIGFIENRSDFERLESETSDAMAQSLFAALAPKFAEHGFTALEEVYITEDDEQGDTEVKYFVCVRLVGHSRIVENERPSNELADLMTGVTAAVCCAPDGTWLLHPEDWELASIDDPEVQAG